MALDRPLEQDVPARALKRPTSSARPHVVDLSELETTLGHNFRNRELLDLALTHAGAVDRRVSSYQRLEFLGDRVLGLAVASMLYAAFPDAEEGELSRRLADLVRRESCAAAATRWGVEPHIRLGAGEVRSHALRRAVAGDVCEAIIGAVYLDGGFEAARALVERTFSAQMSATRRSIRDPKTELQEWAQGQGLAAPVYSLLGRRGPDHAPEFMVGVSVGIYVIAEAQGASKRAAEQAAAAVFMAREGLLDEPKPT